MSSAGEALSLWKANVATQDNRSQRNQNAALAQLGAERRQFPVASTLPRLPMMIPDEILDYYGWLFCQAGFLNLHMTFEGFLAVVAAVSPSSLGRKYEASDRCVSVDEACTN